MRSFDQQSNVVITSNATEYRSLPKALSDIIRTSAVLNWHGITLFYHKEICKGCMIKIHLDVRCFGKPGAHIIRVSAVKECGALLIKVCWNEFEGGTHSKFDT